MNLKSLDLDALILKTEKVVGIERSAITEVIKHLQEINDRKGYLKRGYPNLYEMVTKHFGYSAGAAMRRINSMRLIKDIPAIEEKLATGELSLSVAAEVQSFFYQKAKQERAYSVGEKIELIESCLGKSKRDVEKELCSRNPEREKRETAHRLSRDRIRISINISDELNAKLEKLKALLSHVDPAMTTESLLDRMAELALDKYDPQRKAQRAEVRTGRRVQTQAQTQVPGAALAPNEVSPPPAEVGAIESTLLGKPSALVRERSRYIRSFDRHRVAQRHDGQGCEFVDDKTGRRCGSHRFLQFDHVKAYSCGGESTADNLRFLCGQHNRAAWASRVETQ